MIKEIRERVAQRFWSFLQANNPRWQEEPDNFGELDKTLQGWMLEQADKALSIRLNDKGEPDPEGRYAVKVVDLKGVAETQYHLYGENAHDVGISRIAQDLILKDMAGFARIVEE